MKILFINLPFSGHVLPTLGLAEKLKSRNVEVTYLLTPEWEEKICLLGIIFVCYPNHKRFARQMRNAYEAAITIAGDYDAIVYEHLFFLGKHIADAVNKPAIRLFTTFAANDRLLKSYIHAGGAMAIFRFEAICKNWTKDVTKDIDMKTDNWLKEITHNPPDLNIIFTAKEFQVDIDDFPSDQYKFIGTSIYKRNDESPIQWDKIHSPLIYISLGTVVNNVKAFYRKCMKAFKDQRVTVIMSVGKRVHLDSLGKIPKNFFVYPFVPQLEVLKRADVFITHGGMNSVNEALYYGVPMLVIPFGSDQPANADRVTELHLGKKLMPKDVTAMALRNSVTSIMTDKKYNNISTLKENMRRAGGNDRGADIIIDYIEKIDN